MNHTPGPWEIDFALNYPCFGIWEEPKDDKTPDSLKCIAMIDYGDKSESNLTKAEAKANAHLITAAPELLWALEKWNTFMDNNYNPADISWWNETKQALAKAKGIIPNK